MTSIPKSIGPYLYKLNGLVRETRMSIVWSATTVDAQRRAATDDEVVLKVARMNVKNWSLTNQKAIENEEDWLRRLRHPGVIQLRTIAEERPARQKVYRARTDLEDGPWFLAMDYLPGGTLAQLISDRKRLSTQLSLQIAKRIGEALVYIHSHKCVHRDIKPSNILFRVKPKNNQIDQASSPIVIDFGIATDKGKADRVVGTPRWMALEAESAMRQSEPMASSPSWDIYALGLMLYNMVTGKLPPTGVPQVYKHVRVKRSLVRADETVPVREVEQLTAGLNQLIRRCVHNDPGQRPSAGAFTAEVTRLLTLTSTQPVLPRPRLSQAAIGGILAVVALLIGLLVSSYVGAPDAVPTATLMPTEGNIEVGPVATNTPTATVVPTAEVPAAATPSPSLPTAALISPTIVTPTPNITPSATSTAVDTPTSQATATPLVPTLSLLTTATATPTATSQRATATLLQATSTPRVTATLVATPTRRPPTAPPAPVNRRVRLVSPALDQTIGSTRVMFAWQADFRLGSREMFEVVIWKEGQDPFRQALGLHAPIKETLLNLTLNSNIPRAGFLQSNEKYYWGVLIVHTTPTYQRVALASDPRRFIYKP